MASDLEAILEAGLPPRHQRIYCNRTLNMRRIKAVGFDMDYTLVHYDVHAWEGAAYRHSKQHLIDLGWPLETHAFDSDVGQLGLIIDVQRGNIVKANRFGYIKKASHGTAFLPFDAQRDIYASEHVDLSNSRWQFMNTLFSLSEACLYAQCVDLADADKAPRDMTYSEVYEDVRAAIERTHISGELKAEIMANPEKFVERDPNVLIALQDLRAAGKKVALITNSEWSYTQAMMKHVFEREDGVASWRSLFDLVVVAARKPIFFTARAPVFEIVDEDESLMRPHIGTLKKGHAYLGGHAGMVEASLGVSGEDILYVGDHIFSDVNISKQQNNWRTALVVRELEDDLKAIDAFETQQRELHSKMESKAVMEHRLSLLRCALQRARDRDEAGAQEALDAAIRVQRETLVALDAELAPLAIASGKLGSERWGPVMRAGNDKSHLARQVERKADIYTSRVGNFALQTPYFYLRAPRGTLPHDNTFEPSIEDQD